MQICLEGDDRVLPQLQHDCVSAMQGIANHACAYYRVSGLESVANGSCLTLQWLFQCNSRVGDIPDADTSQVRVHGRGLILSFWITAYSSSYITTYIVNVY